MNFIARELSLLRGSCAHKPRLLAQAPGATNKLADALSRRHVREGGYPTPQSLATAERDNQFYTTILAASQGGT